MSSTCKHGALVLALLVFGQGCAGGLSQPFDQLKGQPIRMLRLQNFEPPPQQQPQAVAQPSLVPPQIQQWLSAGAQLLPPGLIPPGLLPGGTPTPTPQADAPRFHGFRIVGWMDINDGAKRDEVLDVFGHDSSFTMQHNGCMLPEFGFSIAQPNGQPPADVLVSLACANTQAFSIVWPYGPKTGITSDTEKRIIEIAKSVFPG